MGQGGRVVSLHKSVPSAYYRQSILFTLMSNKNHTMKNRTQFGRTSVLLAIAFMITRLGFGADLRIATFETDATPPVGSPLAYNPMVRAAAPLTCRGIVLVGNDLPVVLCAVDWIGIANEGYEAWRRGLAEAAGTVPERVSVHTLHQHDAPICDFSADALLTENGLGGALFDSVFARQTIHRAAESLRESMRHLQTVTHVGTGEAKVDKVASNRRILGPDGKVAHVRWTATKDPAIRAEPEGVIDPYVKLISFWGENGPLGILSYYATHPQSYYLTGVANPDFPGMARNIRQHTTEVTQIHFNGAGGNIGAGKWNDGSPENRAALAYRLAEGMKTAWAQTTKQAVTAENFGWSVERIAFPARDTLNAQKLEAILSDRAAPVPERKEAARSLVWLRRCQRGETLDLTCLAIGAVRIVNLPGEPVVEYQLAAQRFRRDLFVAVGGYTDYAPGYICLKEHYAQNGYEDSTGASLVAPEVEDALMPAIRKVLNARR